MQGRIKEGQVYLVVASFASSAFVSFSLLTLVCSEVLTDTEVFLILTELGLMTTRRLQTYVFTEVLMLNIASLADSIKG